jgi:trehalose 6-phosphate synthase/phosphatase
MNRLLIVSNRLPVRVGRSGGELTYQNSAGGLATGLKSFYRDYDSRWIGWPGLAAEEVAGREREVQKRLQRENCLPIHLSREQVSGYYEGCANATIWPLFHYFPQYARFDSGWWRSYRDVNQLFADRIADIAKPGDRIWIHDYHLMLLPAYLRSLTTEVTVGFFLHIPFPSFEIFRLLPEREEVIEGLLGSDLVGFHSYEYARHFLSSVLRLTEHEQQLNRLNVDDRKVMVDAFPIGIDYERWEQASRDATVTDLIESGLEETRGKKVILSVDRLDYSKGIVNRLLAFDHFLTEHPHYRERVAFILLAVPSRTAVDQYGQLKQEVDELVGRINSRHGSLYSAPISYFYGSLDFKQLAALYSVADIALVTPIRDGMNLVAKEYVAARSDGRGVLILSETAGAATELGEAIIVNPNNIPQLSGALIEALEMAGDEQERRVRSMQDRLRRYDITRWAHDFLENLKSCTAAREADTSVRLAGRHVRLLLDEYRKSESRLLLIDYDGTLVPFSRRPEDARPDLDLLRVLQDIDDRKGTELVIISGRKRDDLESFFSELDLNLVAEHGAWIRERGTDWRQTRPLDIHWKETIRPVMDFFVDRTPGSSMEEKEHSLVWHYRGSEPDLGWIRSRELLVSLSTQTTVKELEIMEGSKVIEVRNAGVNKGQAALHWMGRNRWDFILAIGDDNTDEDLFAAVPEGAYTCKVGPGETRAGLRVPGYQDVRNILEGMRTT